MKSIEYYLGREQTYLKHFFLERYLERVAYNIGSFATDFVYVDGFSGPWQSQHEDFHDTSFIIAINRLRLVRSGLAKIGRNLKVRCLFIEKDPTAFSALEGAVSKISDIQCKPLRGQFEELIPEIKDFIGHSFSLVFIDPTGWTGFGLRQIEHLLRHVPGEVIVNFMFDYINRFLENPSDDLVPSFNDLFGGPGWESALTATSRREEAIVALYCERMRSIGRFDYVTSTRILKPTTDRTYFYLIYGTRHPKGLIEFRKIEESALAEQEKVRLNAKEANRLERTSQPLLSGLEQLSSLQTPLDIERSLRLAEAAGRLREKLERHGRISYDSALTLMLQTPLVFQRDVKETVQDWQSTKYIKIEGLKPKQRVPQYGEGQWLVRTS